MKKTLLSAIFCIVAFLSTGQPIGKLFFNPISAGNNINIVRFDPVTGFHVTCSHPAANSVHFALTDMTVMTDIFVAKGFTVKDFEIIDRLVFFCGATTSGSGLIGWFDIDSLFHHGGGAYIDATLSTYGLESLDNIELFYDQEGVIHVAGYGTSSYPYTPPYPYCSPMFLAFEAVGTPATGMQYRTLQLENNACFSDVVDMTVTDNYVVYLEWQRSQECYDHYGLGVILQPFPKYNMFASTPFPYFYFQTVNIINLGYAGDTYIVPLNDDPHFAEPRITHIQDDEVAVCSFRRNFNVTYWPYSLTCPSCQMPLVETYLALRTYDLSPMLFNNTVLMTAASIAEINPDIVSSIDGFRYDAPSNHFVALYRHKNPSNVFEHAVTTVDYSLGIFPSSASSFYQTAHNTTTQWIPCSLCMSGGNEYTVSGYYTALNKEYTFWRNNITSPVLGRCDKNLKNPMLPIDTYIAKTEINYHLPTAWFPLAFPYTPQGGKTIHETAIICE